MRSEGVMKDIGAWLGANYFANPVLKVCSKKSLRNIFNRCCEEAGPANEENNARLRELNNAIEPISMFRYYYLRIFGGYETI